MPGLRKRAKKKIFGDLMDALDSKALRVQKRATRNAKVAAKQLDVFDTGRTIENTFADVKRKSPSIITILFITTWIDGKGGHFYPVYPYYGVGTSRRYGPRKWLELGAKMTAREIKRI